jgi:hypothetical protein
LPKTDTSFSKESLGNWGKPNGLPDQALVLRVRAAKEIITLVVLGRHRTVENNTQLAALVQGRPRVSSTIRIVSGCTRFVSVRGPVAGDDAVHGVVAIRLKLLRLAGRCSAKDPATVRSEACGRGRLSLRAAIL